MIEGKPCIECGTKLEKIKFSAYPNGVAYVCATCKHYYTIIEYNFLVQELNNTNNFSQEDILLVENSTQSKGSTILIGDIIDKPIPENLKKLLEEKEEKKLDNILSSFEDPIEEV